MARDNIDDIILAFVLCFVLVVSGCAVKTGGGGRLGPLPARHISGIIHHVRKGQTLWRIARAYNVDLDTLVKVNRIADKTKIRVDQELIIPGAKREKKVLALSGEKDNFIWPIKGRVVGYFKQSKQHLVNKGIDISASGKAEVFSSRAGIVSFCAGDVRGHGGTIILDHRDGFFTVYAYNSQNLVKLNQYVEKGAVIARAGHRPGDDKPMLHFQIRKGHRPGNPLYYLP